MLTFNLDSKRVCSTNFEYDLRPVLNWVSVEGYFNLSKTVENLTKQNYKIGMLADLYELSETSDQKDGLRLIASLAVAHFYCAEKSSKLSYCYH